MLISNISTMARSLVMRQMDEKSTDQEVSLMVWSPKMDILALAFDTGCLSLYRLQWQKIWTAEGSVEGEGVVVRRRGCSPPGIGSSSSAVGRRDFNCSNSLCFSSL